MFRNRIVSAIKLGKLLILFGLTSCTVLQIHNDPKFLEFSLDLRDSQLQTSNPMFRGMTFRFDDLAKYASDEFSVDLLFSIIKDEDVSGTLLFSGGQSSPIELEIVNLRGNEEVYMKSILGFFIWEFVEISNGVLTYTINPNFHPPPKTSDLKILDIAMRNLNNINNWNKNDDRNCEDDIRDNHWSLFCSLQHAVITIEGEYNHKNTPMEFIRKAITDQFPNKRFEHILMDYNNLRTTQHSDILTLIENVRLNIDYQVVP